MSERTRARLVALARGIDTPRAADLGAQFAGWRSPDAAAIATLVGTAFPAFVSLAERDREGFEELAREGWQRPRDRTTALARLRRDAGDVADEDAFRAGLRRGIARERLRLALRELLPARLGGADVDVTSEEVAILAEASIELALEEAESSTEARLGAPAREGGERSRMVVLGMGKLGGRELNVGSDVDLLYVYDTDDGESGGGASLHEHWSRVARRMTATLDEPMSEGLAWRVDLRLRPEGSRGAIVNSVAAAIRYYEGWGRPWERAALLRARPVAGDLELGARLLHELAPFVYRRRVDPAIVLELARLVERSRDELGTRTSYDLKLGRGGIREAEFFVQALQLVWGGQEPSVRETGMLVALAKLRARGLVSEREAREIAEAYLLLRRLEHRVQWATGVQTHAMPTSDVELGRLARSLGYATSDELAQDLERARSRVVKRFDSLLPSAAPARTPYADLAAAVADHDEAAVVALLEKLVPSTSAQDLARDLVALARRPDDPLGTMTAERFPELAPSLLQVMLDAADPEMCARTLRAVFSRVLAPAVYVTPMGEDPRAVRRLATVLGASAFVGTVVASHPDLRDRVMFARTPPTPEQVAAEILGDVAQEHVDDPEAFVGMLREAKLRVTVDCALADLAGDLGLYDVGRALSAVADATLSGTTSVAAGTWPEPVRGLAIVALGKLGGRELGYGSDLDVIFLFDPDAAPSGKDPYEHFARLAQRIIRWVTTPHASGPGYELDTRLRPSGSQGMLVTSLASFARYHGIDVDTGPGGAAPWERQALLKARFSAGDRAIGERAIALAERAAYEGPPPDAAELHRLRMRMEVELGKERPGRYNLKTGYGGLVDVEFAVQLLQMRHGTDRAVRTTETRLAIDALEAGGHVPKRIADVLREGHLFLRRLEQRIHIVHASSAHFVEEKAEGLGALARRMGLRDGRGATAAEALVSDYLDVTERVRRAYCEIVGVPVEPSPARLAATPTPDAVSRG